MVNAKMRDYDETTFLNVDLDIYSRSRLEPLVEAFGEQVLVHYVGREGSRHSAHLALAESSDVADDMILSLVALVRSLPRSARQLWNRAQTREFNVGIQAGKRPYSHELRLEPQTLEAVARVRGRIVITTYGATEYPPDPSHP
ncbi:MAG TPA: hypothetical protein VGA78_10700 [Gemmatimonadales bacterium]